MKNHLVARELLDQIEQVLGDKPRLARRGRRTENTGAATSRPFPGRASALDKATRLLYESRPYLHVAVYLNGGTRLVRHAASGAVSHCYTMEFGQGVVGKVAQSGRLRVVADVSSDCDYYQVFPQTLSEIVVPIKIGSRVLGVIDVESDRHNAFAYADRVLLTQVAKRLTRYLGGAGKYLLLEARETVADHLRPRYETHVKAQHRAAAGDRSRS